MRLTGKQGLGLLVTGAAVGAAVALLYAPKSGVQMRKDVKKFSRRTADRIDDLQQDFRDQVGCWVENVADVVTDGIKTGKKVSSQTYDHVMGAFDVAKRVVEDGKHRLEKILA